MRKLSMRLALVGALAGVLFLAPMSRTAFAQEPEGKSEAKSEKSGEEKPGLELWKWANFAILAGVLGWLISKNMGPMLVERSRQIQEGLAAGERAKADADARAAAVSAKLSGLGESIERMKAEAREDRERESARIQRETAAELERVRQNAAFEIESAAKMAKLTVQRQAARLAIELAEQKVRSRMSPETQAGLLQDFFEDIKAAGAGKLS